MNTQPVNDTTKDWFWEGNIVETLAEHLALDGWNIVSKADTHSKERGVDIASNKNGTELLIEAKGYPSTSYRDPNRAGERKPTNPSNQAQHWFSHALLKAMRLQSAHRDSVVAMAFPNFPRYRDLYAQTKDGLEKLGIVVFFVSESGEVEMHGSLTKA